MTVSDSRASLEADIIITATGLNVLPFGGIDMVVDDQKIDRADKPTSANRGPKGQDGPAHDTDLARGQSLNLWLATLASTVGFWAWTMIGPLSARYTEQMSLAPTQTAVLVAMPILVGAATRSELLAQLRLLLGEEASGPP